VTDAAARPEPAQDKGFPSAVILAAGESRRFWPLSSGQHKSLYVLDGISILERTVRSLVDIGVSDIVVVQSPRSPAVGPKEFLLPADTLPSNYGPATLRFVEQPTPDGQGDAILRCADLLGDWFLVVQPENINAGEIGLELLAAREDGDIVVMPGQRRQDFSLYAVLNRTGTRLNGIVEKPQTCPEPDPLCSMGLYLFERQFIELLRTVEQGPLSIIHAIDAAAKADQATVVDTRNVFLPLKFPGHLWGYARMLGLVSDESTVSADDDPAEGGGRMLVGEGCVLGEVFLDNVIVAPGTVIGSGAQTIGLGHQDDLDAIAIGPGVTIGENVRLAPGVRIGAGATIGSGAFVVDDVPDGATVPSADATDSMPTGGLGTRA
jgi:NDP-sugar pyrophosphorylase family protein